NIGSRNDGASNLFNGLIDDVRIYNRALSSSEVSQMYNSTKDGYLGKIKVSTGLVGYWKLDDNNVLTSVIDYSGKGNTGTAYSGTATSTSVLSTSTAMIGRAMSFDGVDDYVGIPANANFNFSNTNQVTWQSWIKVSSDTGGWQTVVGSITQFYFWVNIHGTAYFELAYRNTSDATQWGAIAYPFQVGTWYHIAATLNGNVRKYYVNGVYLGQVIGTGTIKNINMSARIGLISGPTYMFNGLIDEVKIWNYARSAEQIKQDYERGVKGLP
ncbi:MAG: hypothetical protein NTV62_04065, partial [Candidatus Gribaldobacteria bacterium]|nr:hypothetical protein [Candidatus Gribaldobacteria bacterium]